VLPRIAVSAGVQTLPLILPGLASLPITEALIKSV
jgi:hypothetical protein